MHQFRKLVFCMKHVEFQAKNKFAKMVHLVGLIIKKYVTMHGHVNVKYAGDSNTNGNVKASHFYLTATTTEMALIKTPNIKFNEHPCSICLKLSYNEDILIDNQQDHDT